MRLERLKAQGEFILWVDEDHIHIKKKATFRHFLYVKKLTSFISHNVLMKEESLSFYSLRFSDWGL